MQANQELTQLAEVLNSAREDANSIEAVAAQSSAYGHIAAALKAVLLAILGTAEAVELAYQSLLDGETVDIALAYATGSRVEYLAQFDDYALEAMAAGGKFNDFTGKVETATRAEVDAVYAYRKDSSEKWFANHLANEVVGDPNSYSAIVASDTVGQASYTLFVNGKQSEHAQWVTKWGIAYGVAMELQRAGLDAEDNVGIISAVISSLEDGSITVAGTLEFSTILED